MAEDEHRPSFWRTLPGVLTAFAAVLTALTGLYTVIENRSDEGLAESAVTTSAEPVTAQAEASRTTRSAPETPPATAAAASAVKPWAESDAVVTLVDGTVTTFRAEMLSNCISVGKSITLSSGQDIPFERMRSLEILRSEPSQASNARATVVVTLLDGRTINGAMDAGCGMFGYNDIGRFDFTIDRLRRIDFKR